MYGISVCMSAVRAAAMFHSDLQMKNDAYIVTGRSRDREKSRRIFASSTVTHDIRRRNVNVNGLPLALSNMPDRVATYILAATHLGTHIATSRLKKSGQLYGAFAFTSTECAAALAYNRQMILTQRRVEPAAQRSSAESLDCPAVP